MNAKFAFLTRDITKQVNGKILANTLFMENSIIK